MRQSTTRAAVAGRALRQLNLAPGDCEAARADLALLGITLSPTWETAAMDSAAMDDAQGLSTTAAIPNLIQFHQVFLPGFVRVLTTVRKADALAGINTVGSWEDEEIVQGIYEVTGAAVPYGDTTNTPFADWNLNFERRSIVRFEHGIKVGQLEEARAARVRANSAQYKREGAALALEIERNRVGFYGYNAGTNRTYGLLNDPNLPAYVTVPAGAASSTTWAQKTFLEITADLIAAAKALRVQSGGNIDPMETPCTLAIALSAVDALATLNVQGTQSVRQWLAGTFPKWRIESVPEFDAANGGANVFYLYADSVPDSGTDDGAVLLQAVPAKFVTLGVAKTTKGSEEAYTNATAGIFTKRPFAIVRRSGI